MICPRCGNVIRGAITYCDSCGAELTVYKKIIQSSNMYYNKGLARAGVRDLSGAVLMLRKSLEMNKRNTMARNLLGLVYFEMGETVSALGEWVVSKHFQPENNRADTYMEQVQNSPGKFDAMNQAIKKYNLALEAAKQGGDDMAILQLKKAVSLNPNFLRARQLLALLYLHTGDKERAKKQLAYAAQIDVANTTTLRYLKELAAPAEAGKDVIPAGEREMVVMESGGSMRLETPGNYSEDKPNIMAWVTLVVGALLGVLVTFFLIVPNAQKSIRNEFEKEQLDYSSELRIKEAAITSLEKEAELWKTRYEETQRELSGIVVPEYDVEMYNDLFLTLQNYLVVSVKEDATVNELIELAGQLSELDTERMDNADAKALVQKMQKGIGDRVAEPAYTLGRQAYDDEDYEQAAIYLQASYDYGFHNDYCCYYLGRSYQQMGAYEQAAEYYRILLSQFPSSSLSGYTRTRLEEMGLTE
ncbi:MAG: tetratricopeptide repeat protein [Lachnospiraceae bacterium]|nr:tetratricopeptide repeat protein [Lachnospiraceae bacterium]